MSGKSASPLASGRLLGALVRPTCPGDPSFLTLFAQVGPLSSLSAHFGVVQDLIFFDEEALGLMAPLNMDPKVSAKRPSHQPQPPPLLTLAFTACAYLCRLAGSGSRFFSRDLLDLMALMLRSRLVLQACRLPA